ncbi:Degenerin deg-1 [Araneus ventricosus]|uniref:Degenerin deg-1 n=1 Tax=Araneus ventricosus TaxID=182803 RepID=A0A4Y2ERR7_ARAVE|nr:Degenerin deg-1 [Araneus ventricosus]
MELITFRDRKIEIVNGTKKKSNFRNKNTVLISSKFMKKSSTDSISQANHTVSILAKIPRLLVLIGCIIGSTYSIQKFFQLYWKYPIVICLRIHHEEKLEFPAVSICNLNRLKILNCFMSIEVARIDGNRTMIGNPLLISEFGTMSQCGKTDNSSFAYKKEHVMKLKFLMEYNQMSQKQRFQEGHQSHDFLKKCSFEGRECPESSLGFFQNFRYGNCITFNTRFEELPLISRTGPGSGLTLNMKLETINYLPTSETYGAKVIIHDPNETPSPEEEGFVISPGYETSIALKQTVIRRLSAPYKDKCLDYKQDGPMSGMSSRNSCIRECIQRQYFEKCSCIDQTLSVHDDLKPCDLMNKTEACCLQEVLNSMSLSGSTCGCPLPCLSVSYGGVLSRSKLKKETLFLDINGCKLFDPSQVYKEENVRLKVFYSSLQKSVYEQLPKWSDWSFLSFIGNELALWLGMSMVTVFRVLEKAAGILKMIIYSKCFPNDKG